jgi:prevent-host-death family protein
MPINIHEAKTHFSKLIERVQQGEELVIAKAGIPVARLVPVKKPKGRRLPGSARGRIAVRPNFDEPLPKAVVRAFK